MVVHKRKVLLIGIAAHEAPFLVDRLRRQGHPLTFAGNGASGLLDVHRERPALVVTAGRMPIMNGFQFLQVLRHDPEVGHTPVILITETDDVEEMARAGLAGADVCLSRRSNAADISLCVDRALRIAAACDAPGERRGPELSSRGRGAGQPDERWDETPEEVWVGSPGR